MTHDSTPERGPAADFDEAMHRFTLLAQADDDTIGPKCRSTVLTHDRRTEKALVLFHGYTNCPAQWSGVARAAHESGCNVLAPRAPGHGRADRQPHDLRHVRPETLRDWIDDSIDIATGLGDQLIVAGFSFGGVCAAWAARNRDEVDSVTLIAPSFLPFGYPLWSARLISSACAVLPERHLWWDPVHRNRPGLSPYGYDQLSRRGIGAVFSLGHDVWRQRAERSTTLPRALLVLNERDIAISAVAARRIFSEAIAPIAGHAEVFVFPFARGYPHDLIDPYGRNASQEPAVREELLRLLGVCEHESE